MPKRRRSKLYTSPRTAAPDRQRILPTWAWFTIGGLVAVLIISGLFYLDSRSPQATGDLARGINGVTIFPDPGRGHLDGEIDYAVSVPPGGPHNPVWQNCGIYEEPIRAENAIHSLEHGAVWITYHPDLPAEQVEALRELVRDERNRLRSFYILSPNPEQSEPILLTAWRAQMSAEKASDSRISEFMRRFHIGQMTPERGAVCTGGVGDPA